MEVATIQCEYARDVQTFRHRYDQRVDEIKLGIGVLPENLCGANNLLDEESQELVRSPQGSQRNRQRLRY